MVHLVCVKCFDWPAHRGYLNVTETGMGNPLLGADPSYFGSKNNFSKKKEDLGIHIFQLEKQRGHPRLIIF